MSFSKVTIAIPAHNEAEILEKNILKVRQTARSILSNYQIVIAEDGSTDGTDKIAASLSKKYNEIKHLHSEERLGKGEALKRTFKKFKSDIFIVLDADLSVQPKYLPLLLDKINGGYDVVIGSRMAKGSNTKRSLKRAVASRTYNWLVRRFFDVDMTDMQCGFKAFNNDVLSDVLDDVEAKHWFFDTEVLVRANNAGYKIAEVPIEWKEVSDGKIKIARDGRHLLSNMIRFWWKLQSEKQK